MIERVEHMIEENEFSVITMNLRFGLADDGENAWENRKHLYPELLGRYSFDFLGVQESNHFQTQFFNRILRNCHYIGMRNTLKGYWQNNIIFYKNTWHCRRQKHYFLSETPERESKLSDSTWPRQCTIGLFEHDACKLIHVNTHFDFKETVQNRSAELIMGFLSEFPDNLPVVITGDFNAHPPGGAYRIFRENGFDEVFDGQHSFTFHEFTGKDSNRHIDWILYRGKLKVVHKKIITDSFSGKYASDHFPVTARFQVVPAFPLR